MLIDWLERIGVGAFAVLIFVVTYAIVMSVYFIWRKKKPYQKYLPEIIIVAVTLIISIVFKAIMVGKYGGANGDPYKPAYVITKAIYDAFGGFTFEGLAFVIDENLAINILLYSFYVGTTLLSAVVAFSVITTKVSYEVFSRLRLIISRSPIVRFFAKPFVKEVDTYIFTGLTKETLELAKSIANQYKNNASSKKKCRIFKKSKQRIIFTGNDIPNFDKNNELCEEVMANNFLYISGNGNKQKSIVARLRLNKKNSQGRFVVFAFVADKHIPAEETNIDIVVSDIRSRIKEKKWEGNKNNKEKQKVCMIEYFVLTKRNINYQAYQKMLDELNQEHRDQLPYKLNLYKYGKQGQRECNYKFLAKEFGLKGYAKKLLEFIEPKQQEEYTRQYIEKKISLKDYDEYLNEFYEMVSLSVWNEANAIADSMASFLNDKFATSNDKCVYVWSLGFGQTAQTICKELYVQTARIDDQGKASEKGKVSEFKASEFFVDAFDNNMKEIGGILEYEEPMSIYLSNDEFFFAVGKHATKDEFNEKREKKIVEYVTRQSQIINKQIEETKKNIDKIQKEISRLKNEETIEKENCQNELRKDIFNLEKLKDSLSKINQGEWEKEYQPFAVNLHNMSCLDINFLKSADGGTGLADSVTQIPQYIVVATGDDYRNIRIVNALVFDVLNEKERANTSGKPQVIFVNVWDGKNNDLINTYDIGEKIVSPDKSYQVIEYSKGDNTYLYVVILGNNDKIYSGKEMLSYEEHANYHKTYETKFNEEYCFDLYQEEKSKNKEMIDKFIDECKSTIKGTDNKKLEQLSVTWAGVDLWGKKSNACVCSYRNVFAEAPKDKNLEDVYLRLMFQEHQRWMRLHFVHGWEYDVKSKKRRLHDCLCPYIYVPSTTLEYDLKNVILSCIFAKVDVPKCCLPNQQSETGTKGLEESDSPSL